ncbi:MAG: geranylgeranylglyceryl/heptaprenylglyceryl phosphate synthase [Desulfurococcales archaeon]|nr:geranylgeranylglyceryl/heptaprenylglyceryl phosphate synthase [Desulfurococcales archaeon]
MKGKLLNWLKEERRKSRLHFTLIDPDKDSPESALERAKRARDAGTDAILVGGSTGVHEPTLSKTVEALKNTGLPVILFPGNLNGLTPKADAVLFMTLLNSEDVYYLSGVQVQAAPLVLKMGLEPIPTAYIIVGYGGAAGYIGRARPIPYEHPELVAIHALAGAMMGAEVIYLEAGSGAPDPVPPEAVSYAKNLLGQAGLDPLLLVGGGVRDPQTARELASAGADGLVTGTLAEKRPEMLEEVIEAFKKG